MRIFNWLMAKARAQRVFDAMLGVNMCPWGRHGWQKWQTVTKSERKVERDFLKDYNLYTMVQRSTCERCGIIRLRTVKVKF